jgi:clan AA aspartic protease
VSLHTYTFLYDNKNHRPPALALDIELIHPNPEDNRRVTKRALIDTGADGSVIPERIRDEWNLNKADDITTVDAHNQRRNEPSYFVRISVRGLVSKIVEVTLVDADEILLGRDILNELRMHADGKGQSFALQQI